jgi:ArsR family metal-binding transcriptional regulator
MCLYRLDEDEANELLEEICEGIEKCLDPVLTREQVVAGLQEIFDKLPRQEIFDIPWEPDADDDDDDDEEEGW